MKLTTELIVILSSVIYFPGVRTEDVPYTTPSRTVDSSSATDRTLASSEKTADCVRRQNLATETSPTTSSVKLSQQPHDDSSSTATLPPLPYGEDTFDVIRRERKLFVDKTPFISKLIEKGNPKLFILTRPKRFGKSVFLQMVSRFLEGIENFFNNTEIAKRGNGLEENEGWEPFPVIYIDFETFPVTRTVTQFSQSLQFALEKIATSYELAVRPNLNIDNLIYDLKKNTGKPVSILVDNYDLPLMDNELSPKLRKQVTSTLAKFYGRIRANIDNVRLGLVVGLSILNIVGNANASFTDLSNDERFLSVMGFNSEEFESTLKPYAEKFVHPNDKKFAEKYERVRNDFRIWYGKHRFSHLDNRTQLLNPASMCACLKKREFRDYMGNSLIIPEIRTLFEKNNKKLEDFEHYAIKRELVETSDFEPGKIPLPLFLLCAGFLTIVDYNRRSDTIYLNYPNREIKRVLTSHLPEELQGNDDKGKTRLRNAVEQNAMERLVYLLNEFNFRDKVLSHSLRTDTGEFECTRQILKSLNSAEVDCKERLPISSMADGRDKGDLDLIVKTDQLEHFIEVKYDNDAVTAVMQLICYIIEHESAFLERVNLEKSTFLVGMNVQSSKTTTGQTRTIAINQWTLLPYRNSTIRIDEFRTSSNLEKDFPRILRERLRQKSCKGIDYENSTKNVWDTP